MVENFKFYPEQIWTSFATLRWKWFFEQSAVIEGYQILQGY